MPDTHQEHIPLHNNLLQNGEAMTYFLPQIEGDPIEVLVEVGINQNFDVSTEIELVLSDLERTHRESIFLFINPFDLRPELHYPAHKLWCRIPSDRILMLTCLDVQPGKEPVSLSAFKITLLHWR